MEKLENPATSALHERNELQKRLKINANKQKKAKATALFGQKGHIAGFPLKICNSLIMRSFRSAFPGVNPRA